MADKSRPVVAGCLVDIRSVLNVGAMFRSADGAGVTRLFLAGYTATPEHPRLRRTSLGAEWAVPWEAVPDARELLPGLSAAGWRCWALEPGPGADSLYDVAAAELDRPLLLVVGNEVDGLAPDMLTYCDRCLAIPMTGLKRSLNVAVAFAVAVYHIRHGVPAGRPG